MAWKPSKRVLFFTPFLVMILNFTHSDWFRTQNVNKCADWLTLFTLVDRDGVMHVNTARMYRTHHVVLDMLRTYIFQ